MTGRGQGKSKDAPSRTRRSACESKSCEAEDLGCWGMGVLEGFGRRGLGVNLEVLGEAGGG